MSFSSLFPPQTAPYILSFQFSSWYPHFSGLSIKSTIIRPLSRGFQDYLNVDGVFVPEGSEDNLVESTLSDDEGNEDEKDEDEDEHEEHPSFSFPELDTQIRECIKAYEAVFPKLNFSSPKDASWILPASSPLKCTSPSDVYLLLKSSDFIAHDLSIENVFIGCSDLPSSYEPELVLRKWYAMDRSRELRCFVRHNFLAAISQRDTNYYDFLNEPATNRSIARSVKSYWEKNIRNSKYWEETPDYVFDFFLTRDLSWGHIVDFNPYAPRTDPLLFTYDELADLSDTSKRVTLHDSSRKDDAELPEFRVIDSRAHPLATTNAPAYQHNMVPIEALSLSSGRDIEEFAKLWKKEIQESMAG